MEIFRYIERRFFEISDDLIPDKLSGNVGIVCIGIDLNKNGTGPSPQSQKVAEKAVEIGEKYPEAIFIFTSGYKVKGRSLTEARAMKRVVRKHISTAKTRLVEDVEDTHEEVMRVVGILGDECGKAVIIGQQLHLTRIRALFRKIAADSKVDFFFVKARSSYGGGSQWRLRSFPFFLFWEKCVCFPYLKLRGLI